MASKSNVDSDIEAFLKFIRFEKRYSENTLLAYSTDLFQFQEYLFRYYQINSLENANNSLIRSWIVSMIEQNVSTRSVNRKITTLKTFYKYLLKQNRVSQNPMSKILAPKASKRLPVFVEKDKMETLLNKYMHGSDFETQRNRLIVELFYATGIRLSELINLKQLDVDIHNCQIKVLGKRNKERLIPFHDDIKALIYKYFEIKPTSNSEFLFVHTNGKKMYEKQVYRMVHKYLSYVTSANKKSPHVLRHTFATHMLNNGADLNAIKELLGHSSLTATQIYTHTTIEKLKKTHKLAHPKG